MTVKSARALIPVVAVLLCGCLADENDIRASVGFDKDTGMGTGTASGDASPGALTGPKCGLPEVGTGTKQGELFDANIELKDCDGNKVLLGDLMCGHKLTLIDISAGWCSPCADQASTLDSEIYEPFRDSGLQVISILFEDAKTFPANATFCKQWTSDFGLTSPVLYDPVFQKLSAYFADVSSSTPVNLLVDDSFTIIYKRSGEVPKDLSQTIAAELAK